jgi:hypothetical protein
MAEKQTQTEIRVYEGDTLVNTFSCHAAARAFIVGEYSAAEADMLDVHTEEVEIPEELT